MKVSQQFIISWYRKLKAHPKRNLIICLICIIFCCLCLFAASLFSPSQESENTPETGIEVVSEVPTEFKHTSTSQVPSITPTITFPPSIAPCIPQSTKREVGIVVNIVDGDTIDVSINGNEFRIRYIGIDTPERNEPLFDEAMTLNSSMVLGKEVLLVKDVSEVDIFDRLLRYVLVGNTFVNYELIYQGYAESNAYPPDVTCQDYLSDAESYARDKGFGIWGLLLIPSIAPKSPEMPAFSGSVIIENILYDGAVKQVESDEYVVIKNTTNNIINLSGWRLNAGAPGQDFYFPDFNLQPGQVCRVYTDEIHQDTCGFSFKSDGALWNNKGDCGYLFDSSGVLISQKCY
ncbi:lamin tail domain-containing protein [Chloroflexota bacterium]